eukprot:CAMPEP_0116121444 /NCGR_PEP_ID=MMETSP0329-20121206/3700_1 /TAXON_ID=697910 /ORGANISM="Pseudo-nitzschia arenysensis, Strain B593" /LENGTH=405 /DNA_ID=CAMNT_0003615257 /DNA_START=132 /DNA_END=1349 /DNA_ORIENTATION=+
MEKSDTGRNKKGHMGSNGNSADDAFSNPNRHQMNDRHRQQNQGDQHRRKRPREKNNKRGRSRQRKGNGDQSENRPYNNQGNDRSMQNPSENDIFVQPNQKKEQQRRRNSRRQTKPKQNRTQKEGQDKGEQRHLDAEESTSNNKNKDILEWDSPKGYVPLVEEEAIVKFMFDRNGKRERGMLKGKPSFVVSKFKKAMHQCAPSMTFPQVLSLRRHHIKLFNPYLDMTKLGLGKLNDINASARQFELAIESFLKKSSIEFRTEKDQQEEAKKLNQTLRATPDFLLPKPILLRKTQRKDGKGKANKMHRILEERRIHWIEAKMYYGASSIPHGSKGAVGSVLKKAQMYVETFGEGAMLFMMGCGDKLAAELKDIGVTVLDCFGNTVSLDRVHDHQRTWCANEKGQILP